MRVAFATFAAMPDGWSDDHPVAELVGAEYRVWDDPAVDWHAYDRVIVRSVWDYTQRVDEFVAWCRAVGPGRLRNVPELVAWNTDKRYLADLQAPTVPTRFAAPGDPAPVLEGEVVVKPNVSAGALDTGRFPPGRHGEALQLIERIHRDGRVALIQPYLSGIDEQGETAVVFLGGEISHVLAKRPVLRRPGEAPTAPGTIRAAAAMFDPELVVAGRAGPDQLELATAIHDEVGERFGTPLYARVDLVPGADGTPVLIELEVIEPNLYLAVAPGAAQRLASAIRAG
jgi:hypothetical protein